MALYLNVPYSEKDEAKTLGAKWNPVTKKWYVESEYNYHKFIKWYKFSNTSVIVCDRLFIVVSKRTCFKCKNETPIISLATDSYVPTKRKPKIHQDRIVLISEPENMPERLQFYLKDAYNFHFGTSKIVPDGYFANHCVHCRVIQGNNYLYEEPSGPFNFDLQSRIDAVTIYNIKLSNDLELNGFLIPWKSGSIPKSKCPEIVDLELEL